jgi:hypothetical protein
MSLINCNAADKGAAVRPAAVAGQFYAGNSTRLREDVRGFVAKGTMLKEHPRMIISPHAGYVFSGPVAGIGYATIDRAVKKVILLGPSHRKYFTGISIPAVDAYATPLGSVPLHKKDVARLRAGSMAHAYPDAHAQEHCLEVQLPFLQTLLSDFTIVPIIVGDNKDPASIADLIYPLIDAKTLVVVSSDFSHYHTSDDAKIIDKQSIETIMNSDAKGLLDACGETPIRIAMHLADKMSLKPVLLDARNSSETAPPQYADPSRVVGYASIVYVRKNGTPAGDAAAAEQKSASPHQPPAADYSDADKQWMIVLARNALDRAVHGDGPPVPEHIPETTKELCGCFVTLKKNGDLRGCIGYIEGIKPLYQAIIDNARNAALSDPRFSPVVPDELTDIRVEISVLTRPEPFDYRDPDDLLKKIRPGIDGIILKKGFNQSTFLPQVWDQLPDKITFLEHLAMKARLGRDDWKDAQYKKYQAIHFEEK